MQNLFSTFAVLVGSIVLAIVFGNVAMLVSNFNANSTSHQRKMEDVFATMNKLQLPADLRDRINQYYDYVWQEYESLDGDLVKCSKELTHTLALEVGLYRHMNLVVNVPFWQTCSPDFVKQLVLHLTVRIYLPDDYVVRPGEVGDAMFLVSRGTCEFLDLHQAGLDRPVAPTRSQSNASEPNPHASRYDRYENHSYVSKPTSGDEESGGGSDIQSGRSRVYAVGSSRSYSKALSKLRRIRMGQSFGKMALLLNYRRTATVRAVSYVEMCVLKRKPFQMILTRYADDRGTVLRTILTSCVEKGELPVSWSDLRELLAERRGVSKSQVPDNPVTIAFGFQQAGLHRAHEVRRVVEPIVRRRSQRTPSKSQLEVVAESDQTVSPTGNRGSTFLAASDGCSSPTPVSLQDPNHKLQAQLVKLDERFQTIQGHQVEVVGMLHMIKTQLHNLHMRGQHEPFDNGVHRHSLHSQSVVSAMKHICPVNWRLSTCILSN